ncbi:hypothetical protein BX666DRAFT_2000859 [Dichotomocladium elegans]|nr:hypothetical protein BX666DRAFT_2000859 [Dichotomocladium elegans]
MLSSSRLLVCVIYSEIISSSLSSLCRKKVTFYLMKLAIEGVYLLSVLCQVDFPQAISDTKSFLGNLDELYSVYNAVKKTCATLDAGFWEKAHRKTLDTPVFTHYIDKSRSKGRRCFVHYGP